MTKARLFPLMDASEAVEQWVLLRALVPENAIKKILYKKTKKKIQWDNLSFQCSKVSKNLKNSQQ